MEIESRSLTTCVIAPDGSAIQLGLIDAAGNPTSLKLPVDQIGALAMTLPALLQKALQARYRDRTLRYVYPLDSWTFEASSDPAKRMITLCTADGFSVSFALGLDQCDALAEALMEPRSAIAALAN